ncbi:MAG: MFS transporter [Candidatus Margulisiibacteriota bacterium]
MKFQPVLILFATLFIVMVGFGIIFPVIPFISLKMGASPLEIGFLMASYSLMQFIFSPFWGSLSDRIGRKPVILAGLLGFAITLTMFGFAVNLFMLFAARILGGILSSACLPTAMAYIADTTTEEERGAGMGMMGAAMGLGVIVGPAIGGLLANLHFGAPFFFAAGIAGLNCVFTALFLKESKKPHSREEIKYDRFRHIISLRGFIAFVFFLVFLMSFSVSAFEGTFSLFAKDRLNFGATEAGIVFAFMGLTGVIIQGFLIGKMIKKIGEEAVVKIGLLATAIGFILTVYSGNIIFLIISACLANAGQSLCRPSLASLISKDTEYEEGATMGAMQSIDSFGRILGPIFGGLLFQMHYSLPYFGSGGLNLIVLLIAILLM